ncbi:LLM class flavin-dependent oxidoreductase [Sphingomonas sp.]|uniref:LLM class flavin-dependent oxidoreductase n=1 Tax=Sphingomonas sp. TaxID=28214 RepID=UPI001B1C1336|nr:LLM class flavin-dependent oxidoreductase [Sphingomonas sp.]MBO9712104.1 LLM class flavin-dependent oxidoreductase [Sphingomonas sp.]
MAARQMKLGLFFEGLGHHTAAWRDPRVDPRARQSLRHFVEMARTAERGLFDLLFTADTFTMFGPDDPTVIGATTRVSRHEPMTLMGALAAVTRHIGLVATASTGIYEPFHVARFFASLDQLSGGRSGWNLVTTSAGANFGRNDRTTSAERYGRAREFAEVVKQLWDSWEPDALVADQAGGRYVDPAKIHKLEHDGEWFKIHGRLTIPRSPQGRPIIVQAGQSDAGMDTAAEFADLVFAVQQDRDLSRSYREGLLERVAGHGRDPGQVKILPGMVPVTGATRGEAEDKYARLQGLIDERLGLTMLSAAVGMDLSRYPIDGPMPYQQVDDRVGHRMVIFDLARREGLSIRQTYQHVVGQRSHKVVIGTASDVADHMEDWFAGGACDGFNIMPATLPEGLDDFVARVTPELQRRGLFRTAYEAETLRGNLGLRIPEWGED